MCTWVIEATSGLIKFPGVLVVRLWREGGNWEEFKPLENQLYHLQPHDLQLRRELGEFKPLENHLYHLQPHDLQLRRELGGI